MSVRPESDRKKEGEKPVPELVFNGEYAGVIDANLKLATVRFPNLKYDIPPGTVVTAVCKFKNKSGKDVQTKIEIVVIANATRPLNTFSPAVLMSDGFTSPEDAARKLGQFYPDFTVDSNMQAIGIVTKEYFDDLSPKQQKDLITRGFEVFVDKEQNHQTFLVWRSLCFWFLLEMKYDPDNWWPAWVRYVLDNRGFGLIDDSVDLEDLFNTILTTNADRSLSRQDMVNMLTDDMHLYSDFIRKYVLLDPWLDSFE